MEIILVNDCCTDGSPDIINVYAAKDERIVTLSQTNRCVSAARNAGLSIAKGELYFSEQSNCGYLEPGLRLLNRKKRRALCD